MKALTSALAAIALLGCNNETTAPIDHSSQILLEIEYINYAWVPTYAGFFIDASGDIYAYDREGQPWTHDQASSFTAAELESKYLKRTLVSTRDSAEVPAVAAKIAQINPDQVTPEKVECADAGILSYKAYTYENGRYTPVLLRAEGDHARQNTSAAAQDLIEYVRSLGLFTEMLGCDP